LVIARVAEVTFAVSIAGEIKSERKGGRVRREGGIGGRRERT